jgi:dienelactone hydrolase
MRRVLLALLAAVALTACGQSSTSGHLRAGRPRLSFDYDHAAPLRYTDNGVVATRGPVAVHDVSYRSGGQSVASYLVEGPPRAHRHGIVVVHGAGGDRSELLERAVGLARRGAVALAITEPSSAHPPLQPSTLAQLLSETRSAQIRDVVAVRRAADLLASLPGVARDRFGYLGWSAGAKTGIFVAAADRRFAALALLSAGAAPVDSFAAAAPAAARPRVRRVLGSVDPIRYVRWARRGTLLLEDGTKDAIVPHQALENVARAAPRGTTVRWYAAGHALTDRAYADAGVWLIRRLR